MTRFAYAVAAALGLAALGAGSSSAAQTNDFYIGQLQQFGTPWCPKDWVRADGRLLSIRQNTTLFSLLGTQFGGDGINTFALPDLRDRAPTGASDDAPVGTRDGQTSVTVLTSQLPAHTHGFNADPTAPASNSPANSMMGIYPTGTPVYAPPTAAPDVPMNPAMIAPAGQTTSFPTQMPVTATNWCMAMTGAYPQRP